MNFDHLAGRNFTLSRAVDDSMTASAVGSGGVDVLSTPNMILMFEQAARDAVQPLLPKGYTTVGTRVDIEHLSATPVGETVEATAEVVGVEGRKLIYRVYARDQHNEIGTGTHERFVVHLDRFISRLSQRNGN